MAGNGKVFVSHAHVDNTLCDRYVEALRARGLDVWYDRHDMQAGHALTEVIEGELQSRSNFLVILTPASVGSYWVQMEIAAFRDLVARDRSRLILPVRAGNCDVPLLLRGLKWIDAVQLGFDAALAEMVRTLTGVAAERPASPQPAPVPTGSIAKIPQPTMVVDAAGNGSHRTIGEALQLAKAGERILVRRGVYRERIKIGKSIELFGDGRPEDVVIEWNEKDRTVGASLDDKEFGRVRIANLTVRHQGGESDVSYALWLSLGSYELDHCNISGGTFGIVARVNCKALVVRDCEIVDWHHTGLSTDAKQVTIDGCHIVGNYHGSGLDLKKGTQVEARHNRISQCHTAVWLEKGVAGVFEDNDLRGNPNAWKFWGDERKVTRTRNLE